MNFEKCYQIKIKFWSFWLQDQEEAWQINPLSVSSRVIQSLKLNMVSGICYIDTWYETIICWSTLPLFYFVFLITKWNRKFNWQYFLNTIPAESYFVSWHSKHFLITSNWSFFPTELAWPVLCTEFILVFTFNSL